MNLRKVEYLSSVEYLRTQGLTKSYRETRALCNVSIEIHAGKIYTILGENGSGKSTLVKILSGIIPADFGDIYINGEHVRPSGPADMIARGVSVVLQEVMIAPNRTGLENVLIGRDSPWSFHYDSAAKRELVGQLVNRLSTQQIDIDRPAGELPLNHQQILVIARGVLANPKLLILDEITAVLDLADRNKVFDTIRDYCSGGGAVVFVSHRMQEIIELSDVVYVMHNGKNTAQLSGAEINPEMLLECLTQKAAHV